MFQSDKEGVLFLNQKYKLLKEEIAKVIIGQDAVVEKLLISILCNGHSLLVGVPGLAKTLLIKTLSESLDLGFKRIQFTPDLMPSDITGTEILDEHRQFKFIKGPLFANIILADEINRTPPKTQAALLEAMQEKTITAQGVLYDLPKPFFVLATQNPIEQEGTYPLPEAQLDRFMYQVTLDYPTYEQEVQVLMQTTQKQSTEVQKILSGAEILEFQKVIREVPVPPAVFEYTVRLVHKTRPGKPGADSQTEKYLAYGAGPRAGQYLILGAKCNALMKGKFSVDREDVMEVAQWVLPHRIVLNFKAEAEGIKVQDLIKGWL